MLLDHERDAGPDGQSLVVATVLTTLRRTLSALTPADRIDLSPSPWPQDRGTLGVRDHVPATEGDEGERRGP